MSDICLLTSLQCYVPIYRESYDSESANQEHSQQIILNSCNLTIRTVVSRVLLLLTLLSITLIPSKPSLADSILPQQISDNRIIMPTTGSVEVIVNNAVTNMCDGNFGIQSPIQQELVQNYNSKRGETHTLGPFEAGTELIFYIQPLGGCAPYTYPSTNTNHARVYVVAEGIWRIEWEDLPDNNPPDYDFDDLIITIRISGAYPDFKQNIGYWSGDIYDHNAGAEFSIANYGCALTAISNLLAYYGARNMDPAVLNVWMKANGGFNDKGGVRWSAPTQYRPPGSNVSVIEWVRNIDRDNPTIDLTQKVREYLELHWPVIVKLNMPSSPSGVHYPVLVDLVGTPGNERYIVKDPYYSNNSITELPVHDSRILQAILYRPADQLPRSSLTLYGLSPIEYLIVDASGRRLGYDPFSDRTYWEIPESSYSYDAPFWLPAGENHTDEGGGLVASIPGAPTGAYRVLVHGTGTGDFKLQAFYDDSTGNTKQTVDLGSTQLGVSTLYDLEIGTSLMSMTPRQTVRVAAQPNRVLPGATSIISVVATDGFGYPIVGETVLFYTSLGSIQSSSVTDSNGVAIGTLQAGNTSGVASITTQLGLSVNRLDVVIEGSVAFLPVIERSVPPTPTPTPPPPTEIEISTNSQNAYQLQLSESGNGLSTGKKVYTDRDYRYSSVPESLRGVTYVQTANDDSVKYDLALMVSVNRPFLLYVAHSDDQIPKPSWLNPYRDTGENLTFVDNNDETVVLSVYSTVFSAGTAVLGANTPPNGDDHSMYTVAIQVVEGVGSADSD